MPGVTSALVISSNYLVLSPIRSSSRVHICVDTEFGLPNVLVFTCPHSQGWKRYDDIIDYYEAWRDDDQALEPTVKLLDTGIYPYDRGTAPLAIGAMLLWLGMESKFLDLKPMIYTYWS